jgi:hypothetical protein
MPGGRHTARLSTAPPTARAKAASSASFQKEIEDFANAFVLMPDRRHSADYDPHARFTKSEVVADLSLVETAIGGFDQADAKDRRAFCAYVLFRRRR